MIALRALEYFHQLEDNNTKNIRYKSVHDTKGIAEAVNIFRELLFRHPDALQAGNPFPDSFYNTLVSTFALQAGNPFPDFGFNP